MSEVFNNDASTVLAAGIGVADTTLTVTDSSQFDTSGQFRIRIDDELMIVTGVSGNTWTVTRAAEKCEGVQTAATHAFGSQIFGVLTKGSLLAVATGGSGTVTSFAFINANGFAGVTASPSTTPTLTLSYTLAITGDVTGTSSTGSVTTTLSNNVVTYAKMQQASATTLLGNPGNSLANVQEITLGANLSFVAGALTVTGITGGTVTSVNVSGGSTGLSTSGGPVTGSGTITIAGTLNAIHGGLGIDSSGFTLGQIPIAQGSGVYLADGRRGMWFGHGPPSNTFGYPTDSYTDLDSGNIWQFS